MLFLSNNFHQSTILFDSLGWEIFKIKKPFQVKDQTDSKLKEEDHLQEQSK